VRDLRGKNISDFPIKQRTRREESRRELEREKRENTTNNTLRRGDSIF
jgi:hypothetical protein